MGALEIQKAHTYCSEQPWNEQNVDMLGPTIMKFMEDQEPFYKRWAETWFNNFQFIYGNQAVRWSRRYGYSINVDYLQRMPAMNQKAQTNLARTVAEALSSMIYANLPEWDVDSCSESSIKGKRFKRIIQKLLDCYMERLCMDIELSNAAMIFTVFGAFGAKVWWNKVSGQRMEIPRWQKVKKPVYTDYMAPNPLAGNTLLVGTPELDAMGQPLMQDAWDPVLDQMGKQIIDKIFAGDVQVDVKTPFEYRKGIGSMGPHKSRYWQEILLLDYDEFLDRYATVGGKTKNWNQVVPIYSNPAIYRLAVRHFMRMQFTTPPGLDGVNPARTESVYSSTLFKSKVLVVEHYDAPHPIKWPMGRRVIVCNGEATHVTTPDYSTNKMDGWHPFIEAQWFNVPPSSMAAGPLNDVVAKNRELNIADSLVATAMRRNMGSQLLIKTGSGVDPQRFTGEPGMIHEVPDPYNLRYLHDDMPLPPVLPSLRQMIKEDVYESSGAGDALRGERSPGAPSGYAQRIIQEREESRLSPARKKFEGGVSSIGEKLYCCLVSNVIKLPDEVMGYLTRSGAGEFQPDDVISLISGKAAFGVDVNVTTDSMRLQSKATQQATMMEMATGNPAVQQRLQTNPGVLDEFLKLFDAENLRDKSAAHRDRAQRENEQFSDLMRLGPQAASGGLPGVLYQDDDSIHLDEHTDFLVRNLDEIRKRPGFLEIVLMHIERHRYQLMEKGGQMLNGTNLQMPAMAQQAQQQPVPGMPQIQQNTMMEQANQAAIQQEQARNPQAAAKPTQGKPAPGPTQPAPMGSGGPPQQGVQTPSAQQPAARQQMRGGRVK